jgi:predicted nucleic acid-binding protein
VIVVDTNIIAFFILPGPYRDVARRAAAKDRWCAPLLWRSEFCSVLASYLRRDLITIEVARERLAQAERLMWDREHPVRLSVVLDCIEQSNRSAYDCHFVALAMDLGLKLVTTDEPIVQEFPNVAIHLRDFVG